MAGIVDTRQRGGGATWGKPASNDSIDRSGAAPRTPYVEQPRAPMQHVAAPSLESMGITPRPAPVPVQAEAPPLAPTPAPAPAAAPTPAPPPPSLEALRPMPAAAQGWLDKSSGSTLGRDLGTRTPQRPSMAALARY